MCMFGFTSEEWGSEEDSERLIEEERDRDKQCKARVCTVRDLAL